MTAADSIWFVIFLIGIGALVYATIRQHKTKRIFIPDYARGVRYKKGVFANLVGPGNYCFYSPIEQVIIVDMRPQPFVVERLLYQDALQSPSVISIGAELTVSDPNLACVALKDQVNGSIAMVRDAMRVVLSKCIADSTADARRRICADIESTANVELTKVGMLVSKLEVTEAWSRFIHPRKTAGAN